VFPSFLEIVDSHTEGEPTRAITAGWPELRAASMAERRQELVTRFDHLRRAVLVEPRGFEAIAGALITPPVSAGSACGVIYFNNVGPLWMCGHGTIGVVTTLAFLGRISPGRVYLDTPAGTVSADLSGTGMVTVQNVPARLHAAGVAVEVPGLGRVVGDVAWGGNWFFLTELPSPELDFARRAELTRLATAIKAALAAQGIRGEGGEEIDHIELFGPPRRPDAQSRNFVLCPGGEYDRSPCGTGTSAKMACLHAKGKLPLGQVWSQESITGSLFKGWLEARDGLIIPSIQGRAFITAKSTLLFHPEDPFRGGIVAG
jgi:4-hydroxyproline epimerase